MFIITAIAKRRYIMATVNIPSRNIRHRKGQADVFGVVIEKPNKTTIENFANKMGKECRKNAVDIAERQ